MGDLLLEEELVLERGFMEPLDSSKSGKCLEMPDVSASMIVDKSPGVWPGEADDVSGPVILATERISTA